MQEQYVSSRQVVFWQVLFNSTCACAMMSGYNRAHVPPPGTKTAQLQLILFHPPSHNSPIRFPKSREGHRSWARLACRVLSPALLSRAYRPLWKPLIISKTFKPSVFRVPLGLCLLLHGQADIYSLKLLWSTSCKERAASRPAKSITPSPDTICILEEF